MFCYNCGKEIPENATFCPFCGTQVNVNVTADETPAADDIQTGPEPEPEPAVEIPETGNGVDAEPVTESTSDSESTDNTATAEAPEKELAPNSISSFIWSIVANDLCVIPVLGIIFSIIALTKSIRGRRIVAAAPERYKLKGLLTAAFILSIIDLIGSIIGPIILAAYFSIFKEIFDISEVSDIFTGFAMM